MRLQWDPLWHQRLLIFLGSTEKKIFGNSSITKPKLYLRYFDDIFEVFDNDCIFKRFLNRLILQHPYLKFTKENETESLSVLEIEIKVICRANSVILVLC